MPKSEPILGIVSEAEYQRFKNLPRDTHNSRPSYKQWVSVILKRQQRLRAQGLRPTVVMIELSSLPGWCRRRARTIDAQARLAYASLLRRRLMHTAAFLGASCLYLKAT